MPIIATKTLQAFHEAMTYDQGAKYRGFLGRVLPHIGDAYSETEKKFRPHLGASIVGKQCAREIWYSFHWAVKKQFDGQRLRLFNRGHLEEGRFIALLLTIGCEVYQQDENGKQFKISEYGGHFSGSTDGVFVGCPDLPANLPALSEFKTHNDKSFKKLKTEGVKQAKFDHYVQMQVYMEKMGLSVAVYFAVNKNDDEIYAEIVSHDPELAKQYIERGLKIIPLHKPPDKIAKAPSDYRCNMCDYKGVCKLGAAPETNCRTCEWSEPRIDGKWYCTHPSSGGMEINSETQLNGCASWTKNKEAF